jgi:uncharacterized Zn-finger protein
METSKFRVVVTGGDTWRQSASPPMPRPIITGNLLSMTEHIKSATVKDEAPEGDAASEINNDSGNHHAASVLHHMITTNRETILRRDGLPPSSGHSPQSASTTSSRSASEHIGPASPGIIPHSTGLPIFENSASSADSSLSVPMLQPTTEALQQQLNASVQAWAHGLPVTGASAPIRQPLATPAAVATTATAAGHTSRRIQLRSRHGRNVQQAKTDNNRYKCSETGCNMEFKVPSAWE